MGASSAAFLNLNVPSVASFAGESVRTTVSRLIIKSPCTSVSTLTTSSFRALLLLPFAASPLDILVEFGFLALTLLTLTGPLGFVIALRRHPNLNLAKPMGRDGHREYVIPTKDMKEYKRYE